MKNAVITIGLTINKEYNKELTHDLTINKDEIVNFFGKISKKTGYDFTFTDSKGTYKGNIENSLIINCFYDETDLNNDQWKTICKILAKKYKQDCVVLDIQNVTSELIYR